MKKINPVQLAHWIVYNFPNIYSDKSELTHLKLQKLSYYCYGISIAQGFDESFKDFIFEAWKHGPVCRSIYNEFKSYGRSEIQKENVSKPNFDIHQKLHSELTKVLLLYGSLTPWKIRQQSHLEQPWIKAFNNGVTEIDTLEIKKCFFEKYFKSDSKIIGPEYVFDLSSFKIDGIPTVGYNSFDELVETAKRLYFKNS